MIRISSEKELLDSFRPIDREHVELPQGLQFPFLLKDYLAWIEPSGVRVHLIFHDRDQRFPLGIVFRRDQGSGASVPKMCEWCHSFRGGNEVSLLTATASSNRRIGIHLCNDLSCKVKAQESAEADEFFQPVGSHERIRRIVQRMSQFARRNLF